MILLSYEWQDSHDSRSLDGLGKHSLMLGANAASLARNDLRIRGDESFQKIVILVIDMGNIVDAKIAISFIIQRIVLLLGIFSVGHSF